MYNILLANYVILCYIYNGDNMSKRKRKKKLSIKKTIRFLIPLIILIITIINRYNILYYYQSKITNYKFDSIKTFHELNIYNDIKKNKYSTTLEKIISTEYFNKKNINNYINIDYKNTDNFFNNINLLINLGYNSNDINNIYNSLDNKEINILIDNNYLKDISNILKLNYFKKDNLERYLKYEIKDNTNYENLVTYVNIGLDKDYYTDIKTEQNNNDILILVNKYHSIDNKYIPNDLEAINNKYNRGINNKMRSVARKAFEEMCEAALKDNITIYSGSAYRSYQYQENLYNRYVYIDGKRIADTYAARAGHSEHQTGLATDIMNAKLNYINENDKEFTWLVNNSYKYGFILRYPKDKEEITGFIYEEWHFRYIGKEVAQELYHSSLTFDEYVARQ